MTLSKEALEQWEAERAALEAKGGKVVTIIKRPDYIISGYIPVYTDEQRAVLDAVEKGGHAGKDSDALRKWLNGFKAKNGKALRKKGA